VYKVCANTEYSVATHEYTFIAQSRNASAEFVVVVLRLPTMCSAALSIAMVALAGGGAW
jgi:hypothetical protein